MPIFIETEKRYDEETRHMLDEEEQEEWNEWIEEELEELE